MEQVTVTFSLSINIAGYLWSVIIIYHLNQYFEFVKEMLMDKKVNEPDIVNILKGIKGVLFPATIM